MSFDAFSYSVRDGELLLWNKSGVVMRWPVGNVLLAIAQDMVHASPRPEYHPDDLLAAIKAQGGPAAAQDFDTNPIREAYQKRKQEILREPNDPYAPDQIEVIRQARALRKDLGES